MEYTVLFYTHSGAIKFNRKMKSENIKCELMPVPRALSSNCSISAKIYFNGSLIDFIDDEIEKIFITDNNKKELVYETE